MSTELMVAALRRGGTGDEILAILDAVTGDAVTETVAAEPTLETIEF